LAKVGFNTIYEIASSLKAAQKYHIFFDFIIFNYYFDFIQINLCIHQQDHLKQSHNPFVTPGLFF
jgi:hypothetical protein